MAHFPAVHSFAEGTACHQGLHIADGSDLRAEYLKPKAKSRGRPRPKPHSSTAPICTSTPRANLRAGGPGAATISKPITGRSGTGWRTTAASAAPSGSRRSISTACGNVHGGCFMAFADYCLFAIASPVLEGPGVTVSFGCEFLDAAREGELIEGTGEIMPRRRLDDLPARAAEIRRAAAVHVFRDHQAGEAAARPGNGRQATPAG